MKISTSELIQELQERVTELEDTLLSITEEVEEKHIMLETMKQYYSNTHEELINDLEDQLSDRLDVQREFVAEHDALQGLINHYRMYNIQ